MSSELYLSELFSRWRPVGASPKSSLQVPRPPTTGVDSSGLEMNSTVLLVVYIFGIYASFLTWGALQEQITAFPLPDGTEYNAPFMVSLVQNCVACLVGLIFLQLTAPHINKFQWSVLKPVILVSATQSMSSPLGMMSTQYVGYLLYTLAKSCKLVPVMFVHKIWYKEKFPVYKYIVVLIVTIGVSLFSMGGKKMDHGEQMLTGLFLLLSSLLLDGITNSTQDVMFKNLKLHPSHLMFLLNFISMLLTTVYCLITGQLQHSISCFQQSPELVWSLLAYGLCGAIGQIFIFLTLSRFGSMVLITVTVTRKMMSMLLSVVMFGHHLKPLQWLSIALVFAGVAMEAYYKRARAKLH